MSQQLIDCETRLRVTLLSSSAATECHGRAVLLIVYHPEKLTEWYSQYVDKAALDTPTPTLEDVTSLEVMFQNPDANDCAWCNQFVTEWVMQLGPLVADQFLSVMAWIDVLDR